MHRSIITEPTIEQSPFKAFNFENLWRTAATVEPQSPTPKSIESEPQNLTPKPQTETEVSEASFDTVPELSKPTENLFAAIVNRNRLTLNPLKPIQPQPKKATSPMASAAPEAMNIDTPPHHNRIQAGIIIPFSGKRNTLGKFLNSLRLHFILNKIKDDEDKVVFTLTYVEGGDADS